MFEVGKKYKNDSDTSIYTVIHIFEDRVWLRYGKYHDLLTSQSRAEFYREYKEPVIEKMKAQIVDMGTRIANEGPALHSIPDSFLTTSKVVGRVEYTLTDGVLTDAKVLPNV